MESFYIANELRSERAPLAFPFLLWRFLHCNITYWRSRPRQKYIFLAPWTFFVSRARPKPSGNKVNAEPPYNQAKPYGLK